MIHLYHENCNTHYYEDQDRRKYNNTDNNWKMVYFSNSSIVIKHLLSFSFCLCFYFFRFPLFLIFALLEMKDLKHYLESFLLNSNVFLKFFFDNNIHNYIIIRMNEWWSIESKRWHLTDLLIIIRTYVFPLYFILFVM